MNKEQQRDWLRLVLTPELTNIEAQQLLTHIGLPEEIFSASFQQLRVVVGESLALQLRHALSLEIEKAIEDSLQWLEHTPGARMITLEDVDYPQSLLTSGLAPVVFFAIGNLSLLSRPTISLIGSSHPTTEASELTQSWAKRLCEEAEVAIVQTDKQGIEQDALVSVARSHPDCLIWLSSTPLANPLIEKKRDFVANKGLIISTVLPVKETFEESDLQGIERLWMAAVNNFVVIQASQRSKVLSLMREAGDLGREVMAVPGSIHHPLSKGCHQLIKQGASLVEGTDDILKNMKLKNL